jgi:hypothetical protein
MNLDKGRADALQHLHAHGLVVDESARPPVRDLNAAEDEIALGVDFGIGRDAPRRVIGRTVENGRYLTLGFAMAHERAVAPAPKGQGKGIEQDGFARTGFTGQDAQALVEMELKPINEDDIANRQLDEHGARVLTPLAAQRAARRGRLG